MLSESARSETDTKAAIGAVGALRALEPIKILDATPNFAYSKSEIHRSLPNPSIQRRLDSLNDTAVEINSSVDATSPGSRNDLQTVFYLAYGSNLSAETFQGKRGIRPVSQINVLVPELVLTFDLAALPYVEPCFANTRYRTQKSSDEGSEKTSLLPSVIPTRKYHKTRWTKGLVGVVYEVTREDFAKIIATEGGGASYHDVLVDCYELPLGEDTVPTHPAGQPFKAHTLFSPSVPPGSDAPGGIRRSRPDPNYGQPSKRYLKLLSDGANEHQLPIEYKDYLRQIRPYIPTTKGQKIGGKVFMIIWFPAFGSLFALVKLLADKRGKGPAWLNSLLNIVFGSSWVSYDLVFKRIFGDGERTIGDDDEDDEKSPNRTMLAETP